MSKAHTIDELSLIHDGVTVTTLAQIFALDHKDVNKRLIGRAPAVDPKATPLKYRIRDAAPYLVDLKIDPEEYLKSLTPSKLPPALQDAFWKAQLSRQKYEENRGELWRTARVFEIVSEAFKVIRITINMFSDNVAQQSELTPLQRRIIENLSDGLQEGLNSNLREHFELYMPADDEHGVSLQDTEMTLEAPHE